MLRSIYTMLLFLIAISVAMTCSGQANKLRPGQAVYIEPKTMIPNGTAPFDVNGWTLYFPVDSAYSVSNVRQIDVFKLKSTDKKPHTLYAPQKIYGPDDTDRVYFFRYVSDKVTITSDNPKSMSRIKGKCTDSVGGAYRFIKIPMESLPANAKFSVRISMSIGNETYKSLDDINFDIAQGLENSPRAKYTALREKQSFTSNYDKTSIIWPEYERYRGAYYEERLKKGYEVLLKHNFALKESLDQISTYFKNPVKITPQDILQCNCENRLYEREIDTSVVGITIPYSNIYSSLTNAFISDGLLSLQDGLAAKPIGYNQVADRIANLRKSKDALHSLNKFFEYSSYTIAFPDDIMRQESKKRISDAIDKINTSIELLTKTVQSIHDELYQYEPLFSISTSAGTTEAGNIQTASGYYLIPDIGIANILTLRRGPLGDIEHQNFVRPYWGINISFTPINKNSNIRLKDLKYHKLAHFFSFTVGLTAVALNGTNASDLIKNMSIINGIGIRPYKWVRFTVGDLIYQTNNFNPVKPARVAIAPLIGFSVDFDVFYAVQSFISKIY